MVESSKGLGNHIISPGNRLLEHLVLLIRQIELVRAVTEVRILLLEFFLQSRVLLLNCISGRLLRSSE